MNYEQLKNFGKEHKPQLVTVIACGVMFVVGFGTGRSVGKPESKAPNQLQNDYTVKPAAKPETGETEVAVPTKASPAIGAPAKEPPTHGNDPVPGQPCVIKGNISGSSKIYHVKGGASYEKTAPEKCFSTEAEAVAAGFRKAKR